MRSDGSYLQSAPLADVESSPQVHITGIQAPTCSNLTPLQFTVLSEKLDAAGYESHFIGKGHLGYQVRTTPSWARSWANSRLLWLYPHQNAWANLHLLDQPNAFLAADRRPPAGQPRVQGAPGLPGGRRI